MASTHAEITSSSGLSKKPSEMIITLLGHKGSGKSSSGNTILGSESEQFSLERTAQCEKRQGDVAGRHVTVVDTPGWFRNYSLELTSERTKQEIVLSSSLVPPGPHALLLVISASQSRKADLYKNMEEHMELFTEAAWNHAMMLFSFGDRLEGRSIEQYIESEGEPLRRLLQKCGNRYHVFSNVSRADDTQVTQLLDKIEEMVAGEKGGCVKMDRRVEETEKERRDQDERATRRQLEVKKQRESIRSKMGDDLHLSDVRITLLGCTTSGKSSSGNTILGSESEQFSLKRSSQCEKRQGDVAGRHVTVVNTPGWFYNNPPNITSEQTKQEIVRSLSLCPPGPHALLLAIRAGRSYAAVWCKNIEEHMQLFGETAWNHTLLLFPCGDLLEGISIEQFIESEGEGLQRLVQKCGNRYHVFNNKNRDDDTQVRELIDKIEEMVAGEKGCCFKMDSQKSEDPEKEWRAQGERATRRQIEVKKQRESIRSKMGDDLRLSKMSITLLGNVQAGKSSSGNTILGSESEQFSLERTAHCEKRQGDVAGRNVTVVDTPGWLYYSTLNVTSEQTKQEIVRSPSLCPPGPHALLLAIRAGRSYPAVWCKNTEEHMQLLGQTVWNRTMILFSCGDLLEGISIEQFIESEGEAFRRLVDKCGNRYHVFNNENRDDDTQVRELIDKIEEMVAGSGGHYGRGSPTPDGSQQNLTQPVTAEAENRLMSARKEFIQRISDPILNKMLDELLDAHIICDEEMDTVLAERLTQDKARRIIDMVRKKGRKASSFMIDVLYQLDHHLCDLLHLKPLPTD